MDFKLFKLNVKLAWMKALGKLKKVEDNLQFTSAQFLCPEILIIFPVDRIEIPRSLDSISEIISSQKNRDANFSFITNSNMENQFNLYDINTFSLIVLKNGKVDNLSEIIDEIYFKKFDIIIDLNINFKIEIAMILNDLDSKYKIGFVSKYSDYFYNVQLKAKDNNIYEPIKDIIG